MLTQSSPSVPVTDGSYGAVDPSLITMPGGSIKPLTVSFPRIVKSPVTYPSSLITTEPSAEIIEEPEVRLISYPLVELET